MPESAARDDLDEREYEPPAITQLGSTASMTGQISDSSPFDTFDDAGVP